MKNKVQLITYVDRLSGSNIKALTDLLHNELSSLFSGLHLLPFYYPIDGSDAGFDPINHTLVDDRLGTWSDIKRLGKDFNIMADLIVNHMSAQSDEFQDVLAQGKESRYWDLFLTKDKVFPEGLNDKQREKIYRPRPGNCFTSYAIPENKHEEFWTTFTNNQIDIDVESQSGQDYLNNILKTFADNRVSIIRLDAAGYAIKRADTSCFMLEDTFDFINELSKKANKLGIETLVEIHSHYQTQIEIAQRVDLVYDFALPPLILHSLFTKSTEALASWLTISPRNCITVLDTHDGIGIIDVGPMENKKGLLAESQINELVENIHQNSKGASRKATGNAASNVDLYQVNCTYYDALAQDDLDYLIARAIQFFAPGVPQVYYGGLLSQPNDVTLLTQTNVGRDINRPYLNRMDINEALSKPATRALIKLIQIRNKHEAFNGEFSMDSQGSMLTMSWANKCAMAVLSVDLSTRNASIKLCSDNESSEVSLHSLVEDSLESTTNIK